MLKLGQVTVTYLGGKGEKKNAFGEGKDNGAYVEINLRPSKKRTHFDTILIPWDRIIRINVLE